MYRLRTVGLLEGWENAHNDYVEALVEGGAVRLVLSLLAIGLVYRQALRALRRLEGLPAHGLVEGALFGFTTIVLHSFVDFGLHVQAIAVLATVVAAQLCAVGSPGAETLDEEESEAERPRRAEGLRLGGLAPLAGAAALLLAGGVLVVQGWRWATAYGLEVSARNLAGATDPKREESRLAFLEDATRTTPEDGHLHLLAGQAYLDAYQSRLAMPPNDGDRDTLARKYLTPALRHYLVARDLCPLMAKPHVRIAADVKWLRNADPADVYLHRAELVYPRGPEVWYVAGLIQLRDGQKDEAWASWRRSLELSQEYLPQILTRAREALDGPELADKVLPDQADVLWAAAAYLYPDPKDQAKRRPILQKALAVLQPRGDALDAADLHIRAAAEAEVGDPAAALVSYGAALRLDPQQDDWRYEYAELLHKQHRLQDALDQLQIVTGRKPGHSNAQRLLIEVAAELARKG
jgi:tetratricopeptide (TPR) repeat protein